MSQRNRHMKFEMGCRSLIIVAILFICQVNIAWSCSCASASPQELYELAKQVFTGKLIREEDAEVIGDRFPKKFKYTFQVEEMIKGDPQKEFVVMKDNRWPDGGGHYQDSCDVTFVEGKEYIVFVNYDSETGGMDIGLCTGTQLKSSAGEVISALSSDGMKSK